MHNSVERSSKVFKIYKYPKAQAMEPSFKDYLFQFQESKDLIHEETMSNIIARN